tara:strand:+ start:61 stop:1119 length:1059 start_codon:yes stop_codon:yes gene_type:complete
MGLLRLSATFLEELNFEYENDLLIDKKIIFLEQVVNNNRKYSLLISLGFLVIFFSCNKNEESKNQPPVVESKVEKKDTIKETTFNPMFSYALIGGSVNKNSYSTVLNYWEDNCKIEKHKFITIFENGEIATDNILKMEIISRMVEDSNFNESEQDVCFAEFKMPENMNSIPIIILTDVESVSNVEKASWTPVQKETFDTSMLLNKHKFKTRLECGDKWFFKNKELVIGDGNKEIRLGFDNCEIYQSTNVVKLICAEKSSHIFQDGAEIVCGDGSARDDLLAEDVFWGKLTVNKIDLSLYFTTLIKGHKSKSEAVFTNANDPMKLYGSQVNPDDFFKPSFISLRNELKESKRK